LPPGNLEETGVRYRSPTMWKRILDLTGVVADYTVGTFIVLFLGPRA
jgi:hypothetical protein